MSQTPVGDFLRGVKGVSICTHITFSIDFQLVSLFLKSNTENHRLYVIQKMLINQI